MKPPLGYVDPMLRRAGALSGVGALAIVVAFATGCGDKQDSDTDDYEHVMSFDTTSARLTTSRGTIRLHLELAVKPEQRSMGLMERRQLPENAGMLFVYDAMQPSDAGFWMYRTRIPLDIAFLDSVGVVRSIRAMVPCPTTIAEGCPTYTPDARYQYALELNAGFVERHGIRAGDTLVLGDIPASATNPQAADSATGAR